MDINSIKSIKPGNQLPKKLLAIFVSVAVIIGSFIYLNSVNDSAKDTVDIVVVKASGGIPANTLITKDNIGKYSIIRKEFNDDMITYDKVDSILNKYSLYYLRTGLLSIMISLRTKNRVILNGCMIWKRIMKFLP